MRIVSLFSGAGGFDLGFILAGHIIIWANDLFEDAVKSYKYNLGDHILFKDIRNVRADDVPECDIIIGGFPCQGFSIANINRNAQDERNELYKELMRIIDSKKPRFFLAENVKGLVSFKKGEVLKLIIRDFESLGYRVKYKILNSADYGVPQKRERIFIVGVRFDIDYDFVFPTPTHSQNGKIICTEKWISSSVALENIPDPDYPNDLFNHEYSKYKLRFNGYLGHRIINPNQPAPTVTARGDDKGGVVVLHHPNNIRRMSCRELAVIQSFPIDFRFFGNKSSVYRQIANAVPPLLAKAIASQFPNT